MPCVLWADGLRTGGLLQAGGRAEEVGVKTALHELIQPWRGVLDYGGKDEGYTWSGFVVTDRMPDGTVRDRYSNVVREFNGLNAVEGMNTSILLPTVGGDIL